ncbi:MAG: glycosyltransferase family 4 protein [Kiritimatiellae bacterium]|nr:glycosyltransferase family 4 protein [Kiritimatiellia bacterium]
MTVWIVNPFDNLPPEGYRPQRYWLMASAFARARHSVTYWSSDFSHANKAPRELKRLDGLKAVNGLDGLKAFATADDFRLLLLPARPYPANICLRRILSHRALARTWRRMAEADGERPDVVIASLPPLSLAAAALDFSRTVGARFVADIQDAWPETFYRVAPAWLFAPLRAVARRIYRSADAVTAVAARYMDLAKSYGAKAPAHLCHLGIELKAESGKREAASGSMRLSTPRPSPFNLVYIGAMGRSYDLDTVIDAVKEMEDVELDLAGSGPKEAALRARAAGCPRIRFHGYLASGSLQTLLARSHAGVIPMFSDSCVGVPNKIADYAAAGLRVVNSLPGETADIVSRFRAGSFYDAGDVASFKAAVNAVRAPAPGFAPDAFRDAFDARGLYSGYVSFVQGIASA